MAIKIYQLLLYFCFFFWWWRHLYERYDELGLQWL